MQKLHLVGFTTDHKSLILSARRGARSGGFILHVDGDLGAADPAMPVLLVADDLAAPAHHNGADAIAPDEAADTSKPAAPRRRRTEPLQAR